MKDEEPDIDGLNGVPLFLGLIIASIVVLVALTYGFVWLMVDSGN